ELLPAVFRLVQRTAPSFRHRASHPRHGPLWPSSRHREATPTCARCRIPSPPGTICSPPAAIIPSPQGGLDCQATTKQKSVNSVWECLKAIDTRRSRTQLAPEEVVAVEQKLSDPRHRMIWKLLLWTGN